MRRAFDAIFRLLCSLKLAVVVVVGLAGALATATILESLYDTPTSQYWVYKATWFYALLALLGVNIFCVAVSRYPWQKKHGPFLMAHLGILMLLLGSWMTYKYGLDGSLRIPEGTSNRQVEINQPQLILSDGDHLDSIDLPWIPPNVAFKPVLLSKYNLTVTRLISFAEPQMSFIPSDSSDSHAGVAVQLKIQGGPMKIIQDYWLWDGDPSWKIIQAGPATLRLNPIPETKKIAQTGSGPVFTLIALKNGDLSYDAVSSQGTHKKNILKSKDAVGAVIDPGWRGNVKITVEKLIPRAVNHVDYFPSKIQYGNQAPPSAIYLVAGQGGPGSEMWLGYGDRALLTVAGRDIAVSYGPKRYMLPFEIRLDRFSIDYYEGTRDPASYASRVSVIDGSRSHDNINIAMNEPLNHRGVTFYQASYESAEPRPTVTILSVNRDPGRWMKYVGSLLIVLGSIWLFANKYMKKKRLPT